MLGFIENLKQVVAEVQATGGAAIERSEPTADLLQRLRTYAIQRISEGNTSQWVLREWFTEGLFNEYVRICIVHLYKMGLIDDDFAYRVLIKVIERNISPELREWSNEDRSFEEQLVDALEIIWNQSGDEQTQAYSFAQNRWLIRWDYQKSQWEVTGLGRLFLELPPLQAVVLILTLDSLFSTGVHDFRHISSEVLREILNLLSRGGYGYLPELLPPHRDLLLRLSILQEINPHDVNDVELTSLGEVILNRVLSKDNPLRDTVAVLLEGEKVGDAFRGSVSEIEEILSVIKQTYLINEADRNSIETSIELYQDGKYLESIRILYPSIEAIFNRMLMDVGQQPGQFRGLANKAQWLESRGYIPPDVSHAVEVFTGRNRILHGNYSPPEDYVFPLCLLAFRYLRRIVTEYNVDGNAQPEAE